jgi:hypothetical protein
MLLTVKLSDSIKHQLMIAGYGADQNYNIDPIIKMKTQVTKDLMIKTGLAKQIRKNLDTISYKMLKPFNNIEQQQLKSYILKQYSDNFGKDTD